MADFDPFSLNEEQKDNEMPVFGSFDTAQGSKNDQIESNKKVEANKGQDTGFGSFGSFAPFDSGPSNNNDDNSGFPTFESFDSGPKQTKDNDEMPTFESFATPSNDTKGNSVSQSKPPTFDSDSDNDEFKSHKDEEPLFASFAESLRAASKQEEEENTQKEQQEITSEQQNALHFPSFGSFPTFESNNSGSPDLSNQKSDNIQETKSKLEPTVKTQKQESKPPMVTSLSSVRNLLKPIPGSQSTLDLNPDHCKISIPQPKPFKETPLAKELSEYCMKVFNHQYVFTD